jgi:CelD/BcsL family acetyltransferase involved in cellulose biosynthesis
VRAENPCRMILPAIAADEGFRYEETVVGHAAVLNLPKTWDQYLASLDGHERKELRRKMRKVEEQTSARLVVCDKNSWDSARLMQCLDLIEAADAQKREWLRQNIRPMLSRIGERLGKAGVMRLLVLLINEAPAACLIDLPSQKGPMLYNSGFDPALRQWSPGIVTFALAIRDAIGRGDEVFDMMRGEHPYKYKLGATDLALYRLTLSPR